MNERNASGTHGYRYLGYLREFAPSPSALRTVDVPRLLSPENMPPSIRMMRADFIWWLREESLTLSVRAAVAQEEFAR